ncbi:CHAT domain-containing protein [Gloeopeniophorella convolvens]|nr:CHAT domain-containing protein [Gloeopeniophorella convolvens]
MAVKIPTQWLIRAYHEWEEVYLQAIAGGRQLPSGWVIEGKKLLAAVPRPHFLRVFLHEISASNTTFNGGTLVQVQAVDDAILHATETIILPFPFPATDTELDVVVSALSELLKALDYRYFLTRQPIDLNSVIRLSNYLLSTSLPELAKVQPLRAQKELGLATEVEYAKTLLALYTDWKYEIDLLHALVETVCFCQDPLLQPALAEDLAKHLRSACTLSHSSGRPALSIMLALALNHCFAATTLMQDNLPLLSYRDYPELLSLVVSTGDFTDDILSIDESAISVSRTLLQFNSLAKKDRVWLLYGLANRFGHPECLQEADAYYAEAIRLSSQELQPISSTNGGPMGHTLALLRAKRSTTALNFEIQVVCGWLDKTSPNHPEYTMNISHLLDLYDLEYTRGNDSLDLRERLEYIQSALAPVSPTLSHQDGLLATLASKFQLLYSISGRVEDIDDSIRLFRKAQVHRRFGSSQPSGLLCELAFSLALRFWHADDPADLEESMATYDAAFSSSEPLAGVVHLYPSACRWAAIARQHHHPSTSRAYQCAMSAMQEFTSSAPTLQIQNTAMGNATLDGTHVTRMPLDYASYQIAIGQLEQAVETLEQGRSLLWSEMRGLRTSVDRLRAVNPSLAESYVAVCKDLESVTTSSSLGQDPMAGAHPIGDRRKAAPSDPFALIFEEQRRLLHERQTILSRIRALPGFESFLTKASFHNLQQAASEGPIVIINHCSWRCDILIVLHNAPPSHVPTPPDFYSHAIIWTNFIVQMREKYGLDSGEYERALRAVLSGLGELVGLPVFNRLQELGIEEHSRVWWYPTSVFCSLPLHAMGPSYYYVCSYTPTLDALIQSRAGAKRDSTQTPSLLLVGQPDESLLGAYGEIKTVKSIKIPVASLISAKATRATVLEGLQKHSLAHFTCHGELETGRPFEASFLLHGGDRLTLLDIVRSRLPHAELAFLSACHTAELTDTEHPDEALHLAAAMQYCGFRSVVGTMWAMADADGKDLAKHFYQHLLAPEWDARVPVGERSARALQHAVQRLRKKRGVTLERWVNFVHYGA